MPTPHPTTKQLRRELREQFRRARRALTAEAQAAHGKALLELFTTSRLAGGLDPVGLFVSQDGEPNTDGLIRFCHSQQRPVALPCVDADNGLMFRCYAPGSDLVKGTYDLLEPSADSKPVAVSEMALLLMPLVALDDRGNRLGMGGGYYDRLLGPLASTARPLLIGIAHEVQRSAMPLPSAAWDVPLDAAMTESGWITFTARGARALGYTAPPTGSQ